jgi:hypothetical protein
MFALSVVGERNDYTFALRVLAQCAASADKAGGAQRTQLLAEVAQLVVRERAEQRSWSDTAQSNAALHLPKDVYESVGSVSAVSSAVCSV